MAKVPPHNEEAEKSVLGAILLDKEAINIASEILKPEDFYNNIHEIIFDAMITLFDARSPIDVVTLTTILKKKKKDKVVDMSYITNLVNTVPTAANVGYYSRIIKEASTKRSLIHISAVLSEMSFDDEKELVAILEHAESSVFSISQGNIVKGFVPIKETLSSSFERIDLLHKSGEGLRGVKTGFTDLDSMLSGMQASNLLILAARHGQGKTALAMNIAQYVGVHEKVPIGIFSLEMSQEELVDRLLVGQADVDAWKLKTGRLTESDFTKLSEAMGMLADAPIFIDDTPGISIHEIRTKARRLMLEEKLGLIIVDYLQLVTAGGKYESRVQEVGVVSQGLKNLARELKVPVLALSQLSRAIEHRGERKPQLADLRESGSIEQDADVVMFIYRPDEEMGITMQAKVLIGKHRNGRTGEVDLVFRGDRIRFENAEKMQSSEAA